MVLAALAAWAQAHAVLACCAALLLVALAVHWARLGLRGIPGPRQWPLVFNTIEVARNRHRIYDWYLDMAVRYGPVFTGRILGTGTIIVVAEPESVQHMLKDAFANYPKGPEVRARGRGLLGNGIFAADGDDWQLQRKTFSHMFRVNSLKEMHGVFRRHVAQVVMHLQRCTERGESIDMQDLYFRHTLDSIGEIAFGFNFDTLRGKNELFAGAFDHAQQTAERRFYRPLWRYLPEPGMSQSLKVLDDFAYTLIAQRRKEDLASQTNMLSRFMNLETATLDDTYLRDVMMNLVIAGRDTTALTLTWATYLLSQNPEKEAKLVAELESVLHGSFPSYEILDRLEYTRGVINEALRLYPAVPIDPKTALNDDRLPNGMRVPRGALVAWNAYCLGRQARYWGADVLAFRPERWLDAEYVARLHPYLFVPFQAGPRICLGQKMAYLEATVVLASLFQRFRFAVRPGHRVHYKVSVTLQALGGMPMLVARRTGPNVPPPLDESAVDAAER